MLVIEYRVQAHGGMRKMKKFIMIEMPDSLHIFSFNRAVTLCQAILA